MNYKEFKNKKEQAINEFFNKHGFIAFNDGQFLKGMEKLGLKPNQTNKLFKSVNGAFYLKDKAELLHNIINTFNDIFETAIKKDEFLYSMFYYELANLEYVYNMDDFQVLYYCDILTKYYNCYDESEALKVEEELNQYENKEQILKMFNTARVDYLNEVEA